MFLTPKEAALQAENDRLRAENEWLKKHVESLDRKVTPFGIQTDMVMAVPSDRLTLPRIASVVGSHNGIDRWEVIASYDQNDGKTLRVDYFATEPLRKHRDDYSFVNEILPRMHENFVRQLADLYFRKHKD